MSHYVSSPANLSPPHCSPFYKPHVLQAGEQRRCVFHCHWLVRERVFLCFQLHAKRPSGKSICQRARQDLMGAASAGGGDTSLNDPGWAGLKLSVRDLRFSWVWMFHVFIKSLVPFRSCSLTFGITNIILIFWGFNFLFLKGTGHVNPHSNRF